MLDKLFGSTARVKILQFLIANPDNAFFVREITRKLGLHINAVRTELINLKKIGVVVGKAKKNKIYFQINKNWTLHKELAGMFGKQLPKESEEQRELKSLGKIKLALYSGYFTRSDSPVDFLVVGSIDKGEMEDYAKQLSKEKGSEVNYSCMDEKEFNWRMMSRDRFLKQILAAKKRVVVNELGIEF